LKRAVLVVMSLLLLGGLMVSVGGGNADQVPAPSQDNTAALASGQTPAMPAALVDADAAAPAQGSGWQRYGFLVGALVVMTAIMIVTHHRQHHDEHAAEVEAEA